VKKVFITFEIMEKVERVPIVFCSQRGSRNSGKKKDLSNIPKLVQEYNIKYSN